jgi:hypothetical protein
MLRGGNKHFSHTSVCRNKSFLLELRTNCIVLYGTTLKIFFGESPVQSYITQDENQSPSYQVGNDKINEALEQLEMIDSEPPDDDLDLVLRDSDDDQEGTSAPVAAAKRNKKQKKKSRKIQSLESFLDMSDDGVLHSDTFDHYYGEGNNDQ